MKDRRKKICILESQTIRIISRLAGVGISSVIETNVFGTKSRHLSFLYSVTRFLLRERLLKEIRHIKKSVMLARWWRI